MIWRTNPALSDVWLNNDGEDGDENDEHEAKVVLDDEKTEAVHLHNLRDDHVERVGDEKNDGEAHEENKSRGLLVITAVGSDRGYPEEGSAQNVVICWMHG